MKRTFIWAIVFAMLLLALVAYNCRSRTAPAIVVAFGAPSHGGSDYIPAVPGYKSGCGRSTAWNGGAQIYTAEETYTVASSSPGHLFVLAHYRITRRGAVSEIDRALPVSDKKPDDADRVQLDGNLTACAYLADTTLRY